MELRGKTLESDEMNANNIIAAAKDFAESYIAPHAEAWEAHSRLPGDFFARAAKVGLLGIEVPASFGGSGLGLAAKARICGILAGADFGAAMALVNSHNVAKKIAQATHAGIAADYVPDLLTGARVGCTALTESQSGSDFSAIGMRAQPAKGGWQLTGEKAWITNAVCADTIVVYAQTKAQGDASGIGAFLVDSRRDGFTRGQNAGAFGLHSCGAGAFRLDDYFVPENAVLDAPGAAFKAILAEINGARLYVAAMCCGMVDSAIRAAHAWGRQRTSFGRTLNEHQSWRFALAEAATDVAGVRALVEAAATSLDAGADVQLEAAQSKILAARVACTHIPKLIHAMGAEGLKARHPLGRHLVGAQFAGLVDGSTEMLLERVAKLSAKDMT
jgi:alkylation response protein AidB-like acyl-CoA dehydrogenase